MLHPGDICIKCIFIKNNTSYKHEDTQSLQDIFG